MKYPHCVLCVAKDDANLEICKTCTPPKVEDSMCDELYMRDGVEPDICEDCEPPNQVNTPDNTLIEGVAYKMKYIDAETVIFTRRR